MLLPGVLLTTCKTADESFGKDINPYAAGLNKWIQEKNESSLDLTFSRTKESGALNYVRNIANFTHLRAWGLTHHLSELRDPELTEWHKEKLATEIEYFLDLSEHYNGRMVGIQDWNSERFILRELLDALYRLKTHALFPERMGEWLERVKMPVEYQYINYWFGPGQEYLPGWHHSAGYYANSDAKFMLVMGLAGKLLEEQKYLDRAHEFVGHLDNLMLIDGGFHYMYSENEIPVYHRINITSLARYWMVTKDEYALDVIKRTVDYYPLSFGNTGVTERTGFPYCKKEFGLSLDAGSAEIVAAVSGDERNKYLANKFFNKNSRNVIAIDFWRNDIDPVRPEDFHIFKDRNVNGIRGRFGDFSWVTIFGHGACVDGFVGTTVAPSNENSPVKFSAMEMVTPEVGVVVNNRETNAYVTGREYNRDIIYNDGFSAIAVSYQLFVRWREFYNGRPVTGVPWISNQLWLLLPDNVIGRIVTESMENQEVEYFRTRIGLAPFNAIVETGEKEYTVNNLKLILHNHNLSTPTLDRGLVLSANKRKFNTGEKFFLSLEARPDYVKPVEKYSEINSDGLIGFKLDYKSTEYLVLYNPSPSTLQFEFSPGINTIIFRGIKEEVIPERKGSKYQEEIPPYKIRVLKM